MKRLVIVRSGDTLEDLRARRGDFDQWFADALQTPVERIEVVAAHLGDALPPPGAHDGVIITGSPKSVTEQARWMVDAGRWVKEIAEKDVPVLGVCFGHQLVGQALGGTVVAHPQGRESGTVEVTLTAAGRADPIFEGLPDRIGVQQAHGDHLEAVPEGAIVLAGNDHSPIQALAIGDRVRTVQFHPEFDEDVARTYLEARRARIPDYARVRAALRETGHGKRVLRNWERHFFGV